MKHMIPLSSLEHPVAFHRVFARITGSATAGLFLSQAWYWTSTLPPDRDGWFYKTQKEWEAETTLSRREQETARTKLRSLGLIEEERRGIDPTLWFRIDTDALAESITTYVDLTSPDVGKRHQGCTVQPSPDVGKRHQVKSDSAITSIQRLRTETTAETSPESKRTTSQPYLLFESMCECLGQDATDVPPRAKSRQLAAAKALVEDGMTESDVPIMVRWLQSQTWITSGIDMPVMQKMHGKWVLNGKPATNVTAFPSGSRSTKTSRSLESLARVVAQREQQAMHAGRA